MERSCAHARPLPFSRPPPPHFPPMLQDLLSRRMRPSRPSHDLDHYLGLLYTRRLSHRTELAHVGVLTRRRAWLVRDMFSRLLLCSLVRLCASARTRFGHSHRLRASARYANGAALHHHLRRHALARRSGRTTARK
ncbi:hypothetical protein OH77DRAFT_1018999 [Trametes cingulata]|nr:hypothetical protein OH77DRAFT_1018999 [Trametes cingulata]